MSKNKNREQGQEEILKDYSAKVKREAVIKSVILALTVGLACSLIVSVVSYFTYFNTLWIALGVGVAVTAGLSVLFCKTVFRVSEKDTAARVDALGLDERVITMLDYAGSDAYIAEKQRQNTREALGTVSPKQMKFSVSKLSVILLALVACAAIFMMTFSTVRAEEYDPPEQIEEPLSKEDKIIREMIEDLREIIDEAKIGQDLKDELHGMVDDLEASLKPTDSTAVKIAKISETSQKIHEILQAELSKTGIAEQLKKHETTNKLGGAIEVGTPERIDEAFDYMYGMIGGRPAEEETVAARASGLDAEKLIQTADDIMQSLADASDIKPDDPLYQALKALADAFYKAARQIQTGGNDLEIDDELKQDMDEIKDAIKDALEDQNEIEGTDDDIQDAMDDAMDQIGQGNSGENESDKPQDPSDEEEDGNEEGDQDKEDDENLGPAHPTDDGDIIYDSIIDGETPYMDVYEEYYQKAMELLASGTLSDEMRQIIENYFGILN